MRIVFRSLLVRHAVRFEKGVHCAFHAPGGPLVPEVVDIFHNLRQHLVEEGLLGRRLQPAQGNME